MGSSTDWKLTGSQRLTYRSESSEPHTKLSPVGIWHGEKETLSIWHWRPVGLVHRSSTGLGEMETPFLKGAHGHSWALGPRAKLNFHRNQGQTWLQFLEDLLGKQEWMSLVVGEGHWKQSSWEWIFSSMPFAGGGHFGKIWPYPSVNAEKPQGKQQPRWNHSPTLQ